MLKLPKNAEDITGQRFSSLLALEYVGSDNGAVWLFRCDCGNEVSKSGSRVRMGYINSCGCKSALNRFPASLLCAGQKFGRLTTLSLADRVGHNLSWNCQCDCGASVVVLASNLSRGNTKSCGCLRQEVSRRRLIKHDLSGTTVFWTWQEMLRRCRDPKNPAYKNYGARGILVCERWDSFDAFFADMGHPPKGLTLERIDNDAGYSPQNCKWATRKAQARNTRRNRFVEIGGERKVLAEWQIFQDCHKQPFGRDG